MGALDGVPPLNHLSTRIRSSALAFAFWLSRRSQTSSRFIPANVSRAERVTDLCLHRDFKIPNILVSLDTGVYRTLGLGRTYFSSS